MWNRIHAHYSVYFLTYSIPSDFICICVFSFFQKIKTEKINKQNWQINCSWLRFWKPPQNPQTVVEVCVLWNALFVCFLLHQISYYDSIFVFGDKRIASNIMSPKMNIRSLLCSDCWWLRKLNSFTCNQIGITCKCLLEWKE